jgi:hypothetical protein
MRRRVFSDLTAQPGPGGGLRDPVEVAREKAEWILKNHHPEPLSAAKQKELKLILRNAEEELG